MPFQLSSNTHIAQVTLQVSNLDRAYKFYTDILGFQGHKKTESADLFTNPTNVLIRLTEHPDATPKPQHTTGLFHIAIRVPGRKALSQVLHRIYQNQWPLAGASDHGVSEALYLSDPDGNGLEVYIDRDKTQWPMNGDQVAMFSVPLDLQALLKEADGAQTTLPDKTDIGHIHLQVSSLKSAEAFYSNLLGFNVMQRSYRGALFVSAGGYHHHLGLNIWSSEGAKPASEDAVGLKSFTITIPDKTVFSTLQSRFLEAGHFIKKTDNGFTTQDPDHNTLFITTKS